MKVIAKLAIILALGLGLIIYFSAGAAYSAEAQYAGAQKCKICHSSDKLGGLEYPIWEKSAHATSLDSLKPGAKAEAKQKAKLDPNKDYSADKGCIGCHSTGFDKPAAAGAKLEGVQCEACHGPGSEYSKPNIMSVAKYKANRDTAHKASLDAGLIVPAEATCKGCHNEKSPTAKAFDFAASKEKIKHWKK